MMCLTYHGKWEGWICLFFLIAVDYFSGYFEVQDMSCTTSTRVITVLKSWFSRHGIPMTSINDNGPPFNSEDFKAFSVEWDFHHVTSSPYHAQSNGRGENAVKTCKSLLTNVTPYWHYLNGATLHLKE